MTAAADGGSIAPDRSVAPQSRTDALQVTVDVYRYGADVLRDDLTTRLREDEARFVDMVVALAGMATRRLTVPASLPRAGG